MTITLTPEIASTLSHEADRYGTAPELLDLQTLQARLAGRASSFKWMPLDVALADLIAEAEAMEPQPPARGTRSLLEEGLAAKYRAQGIDV